MPSQEVIDAYQLVFETEKAVAVDLATAVDQFKAILIDLNSKLPDQATIALVRQNIAQIQNQLSMNLNQSIEGMKAHYGLNPPMEYPGYTPMV